MAKHTAIWKKQPLKEEFEAPEVALRSLPMAIIECARPVTQMRIRRSRSSWCRSAEVSAEAPVASHQLSQRRAPILTSARRRPPNSGSDSC